MTRPPEEFVSRRLSLTAIALCIGLTASTATAETIRYPEGAKIVDVTEPPFNAAGDGETDDTEALVDAVSYAKKHNRIAYLPNGT